MSCFSDVNPFILLERNNQEDFLIKYSLFCSFQLIHHNYATGISPNKLSTEALNRLFPFVFAPSSTTCKSSKTPPTYAYHQ
jgi:hypothetical protein